MLGSVASLAPTAITSPLPMATMWVEGALTGTFTLAFASIAVALYGFGLLTGRKSMCGAGRLVLGCFILLGSSAIAHTLLGSTDNEDFSPPQSQSASPSTIYSQPDNQKSRGNPFDPYD